MQLNVRVWSSCLKELRKLRGTEIMAREAFAFLSIEYSISFGSGRTIEWNKRSTRDSFEHARGGSSCPRHSWLSGRSLTDRIAYHRRDRESLCLFSSSFFCRGFSTAWGGRDEDSTAGTMHPCILYIERWDTFVLRRGSRGRDYG